MIQIHKKYPKGYIIYTEHYAFKWLYLDRIFFVVYAVPWVCRLYNFCGKLKNKQTNKQKTANQWQHKQTHQQWQKHQQKLKLKKL